MILNTLKTFFGITSKQDIVDEISDMKNIILSAVTGEDVTDDIIDTEGITSVFEKIKSLPWSEAADAFKSSFNEMGNASDGLLGKLKTLINRFGSFFSTLLGGLSPITLIVSGIAAIAGVAIIATKVHEALTISVDEATDKLQEFNEQFKSSKNEYKSHAELVDKVTDSYNELAKKVNTDTNFNLGLDDSEYQDFINMNNELAEAFPSLVKGYDESGNAIIDFGNDCDSATEKLNKLLEAEKQSMNMEIAKNLPEYFENTKVLIEDYNNQIEEQKKVVEKLQNSKDLITSISSGELNLFTNESFSIDALGADKYNTLNDLLTKSATDFVDTLTDTEKLNLGDLNYNVSSLINNDGNNLWLNAVSLPENLKSRLEDIIKENAESLTRSVNDELGNAQRTMRDAEHNKESVWSDFTNNLISGMTSQSTYQTLTAAEQELAKALVAGIDSSFAEEMGNDPLQFVRTNIMNSLDDIEVTDSDKINLANAISDYTNLDLSSMTIQGKEEAQMKLIETIQEIIPDEAVSAQILVNLGLDVVNTEVNTAKDSLLSDIDGVYGEGWSEKSSIYLNQQLDELGINTKSEIEQFQKLFNETGNLTDAFNKYAESIEKVNEKTDDYKPPSFVEQMQGIQNLSKGLDQLDSIMADVIDGKSFDYSSILNNEDFNNTFGGYETEYKNFIETITNSPDDLYKCQSAFDDLATAYVHGSDALHNLTEETKNASILELEQMGVKNAEEIVNAYLELGKVKEEVAKHGYNFAEVTYEECVQLLQLADVSLYTKEALFYYQLQKLLANENPLSTSNDIQQLLALATNAGITGDIIDDLNEIIMLHSEISFAAQHQDMATAAALTARAESLIASIKTQTDTMVSGYQPTVRLGDGLKSLAAKQEKSADATDKLTDALEKQKEALEEQKAEMEELHDAIIWFYDKQIEKIDEKIDAINEENEALEKQQENMDDILAAIENNYDAEIEKIQEKIDAIQEENDEEERALALEEAKRKLQEAKSKKTLQVYQKGLGFTYQVDTRAIKEAEDELEKLQDQAVIDELQKQIDLLEEAKKKWSEIPEAYNKSMQELAASQYFGADWKNITLFPSDDLLQGFENTYTDAQKAIAANEERIEAYEKEKETIEELKQLWEDAKNAYQYAEYEKKLATFFGSDYEYQLLNNSAVWREEYATKYGEVCAKIEELEERIKNAAEEAANTIKNAADKYREFAKEPDIEKKITIKVEYVTVGSPTNTARPGNINLPSAYAKGGIITKEDKGDFDYIAHELGEDHMIAIKEGEAVIPKASVDANKELISKLVYSNGKVLGLSDSESMQKKMHYIMNGLPMNFLSNSVQPNLVKSVQNVPKTNVSNSVNLSIGDIHVHGVNDANGLSQEIIKQLPNTLLQKLNKH